MDQKTFESKVRKDELPSASEDHEADFILYQIGDMEPNCPECGANNAMLNALDIDTNIRLLKCRDCGNMIREGEWEIKQMVTKDSRAFKILQKEGRLKCSDTPGLFFITEEEDQPPAAGRESFDVCGVPGDEYLSSKLDELVGCSEDILQRLDEMESILRDISEQIGNQMILKRAQAYWLAHIRGALEGETSFIGFEDTIKEIKEKS